MDNSTPLRLRLDKLLSPWEVAFLAALVCLAWQAATVHFNYNGNWTALYCIGAVRQQPPEIGDGIFVFPNSRGYDGQAYRIVAHDPWIQRGFTKYMDAPQFRYRRILVPGLAWILAGGRSASIDGMYVAVLLGFVLLGTAWTALLAVEHGLPAWAGLGFLLVPAIPVSIDRLTVDIALVALLAGAVYYCRRGNLALLWLMLAAGVLCRETGIFLVGAATACYGLRREWVRAVIVATSALPSLAWYSFVYARTPYVAEGMMTWIPLQGVFFWLVHPQNYPPRIPLRPLIIGLDYVSLASIFVALILFLKFRPGFRSFPDLAAWLCLIPVLFVTRKDIWMEPYSYGRSMAPFWALVGYQALTRRTLLPLLPMVMMDLRIAAQCAPQVLGIGKGLLGP